MRIKLTELNTGQPLIIEGEYFVIAQPLTRAGKLVEGSSIAFNQEAGCIAVKVKESPEKVDILLTKSQ